MKPSDLSKALRHIASKIDASKRPDRILVARDLKRVLLAMDDAGVIVNFMVYDTDRDTDSVVDDLSKSPSGPVWAGISEYGWLLVNKDPATLEDSTPIKEVVYKGGYTNPDKIWRDLTKTEDYFPKDFKPYNSWQDFLKSEDFLYFLCSGDPEVDGAEIVKVLEEMGYDEAAAALSKMV